MSERSPNSLVPMSQATVRILLQIYLLVSLMTYQLTKHQGRTRTWIDLKSCCSEFFSPPLLLSITLLSLPIFGNVQNQGHQSRQQSFESVLILSGLLCPAL